MNPPLSPSATIGRLRSRPLVFVDDLDAPVLSESDHSHLARSLRVRPGALITVSDGRGRWRRARFGVIPEPDGPVEETERPPYELMVAFVPVKAERSETTVQRLTELGIDRIVPVATERSVIKWNPDRAAKNHARHQAVARESAMQSRRVWLPQVEELQTFEVLVSSPVGSGGSSHSSEASSVGIAIADPDATRRVDATVRAVVVGPEGGFSDAERAAGPLVGLPGGVLRAGTAAVVAATMLAESRYRGWVDVAQSGDYR